MKKGLGYAIIAYTAWGLLPLYWKYFGSVAAGEILSHRVVWSFVFMALLLLGRRRQWGELKKITTNGKTALLVGISSILISTNWLIFIWAVNNGHVIETSLGYYITPMMNVLLGVFFLNEKPTRGQWFAIFLACAGVLFVAVDYGSFPWISLSLSGTFALYGLVKKRVAYDASVGLVGETAVVFPIAVAYLVYLHFAHQDTAWQLPPVSLTLLLLAGVATALPLLWFAKAAVRLPLTMLGFIQYIGPSITLLLSIFVFNETFTPVMLGSFSLIWTALIVYAWVSMRVSQQAVANAR